MLLDNELRANCVNRFSGQPFLLLTAANPVPFGMEFVGRYEALSDILINENPVYRHEYYEAYAIWYKQKLVFTGFLDVFKHGWNLEFDGVWIGRVWNKDQREFLYEDSFSISFSDVIPEIESSQEVLPCKLQISSNGKVGHHFPDQMGVYKLMENFTVYNNPIWKHISKDFYIRIDNGGTWIVTSVSIIF